jgi:hypothetical protein
VTTPLTTQYGPCEPWPVRWTCDVSAESPVVTAQAVQAATEVVWALSGRQFGLCTVTLRPCRKDCFEFPWPRDAVDWAGIGWLAPALVSGEWFNVVCGNCVGGCSCQSTSDVVLPAPVRRVLSVQVDGTPLATGAYVLYDARTLVRADGGDWPRCQDWRVRDGQVGSWSVTAQFGSDVPEGGAWAVGELACEYIKARNGGDCRLPRNVTQLVRQDVTIEFPSSVELFTNRQTGLYLVDQFVMTWNPGRLSRASATYSVDRALGRRQT